MKNTSIFFIISSILLLSVLTTSCRKISDDAEKFVGEWKFCYTNDNGEKPFWEKQNVLTISLKQNGEWILGKDAGKGQWGENAKNSGEVCDLDFNKWKALSPYANQIENLTGKIIEIQGIKILEFKVEFSFKDYGIIDDPNYGATVTANKNYNSCRNYYFVKTDDENLKISNYFKEEEFDKLTKLLEEERLEDIILDGVSIIGFKYADKTIQNRWIDILNYGIKTGKANEKHQTLLDIIKNGEFNPNLDSTASINTSSITENSSGQATVIMDKAYFYDSSNELTIRKSYILKGEQVSYTSRENGFIYVEYTNTNNKTTTGWMQDSDFEFN
jgi:hypothetical protein